MSREALCHRLWPDGTFVDFEHSLNAAIRRLRLTLGDEADTPRFIETVHRRGYRFLAGGVLLPPTAALSTVDRSERASFVSAVPPSHSGPAFGPTSGIGRAPATRARLAVLPFVSFTGGDRHDMFNDGLTEETTTQVARACPPHVGVIARMSVMRPVGTEQSAAEIGRMLGAAYLLEGSVRRERDHVRILAQLIESDEETHLWAATYDDEIGDSLTLQMDVAGQIARAVADALSVQRPALSRAAAS